MDFKICEQLEKDCVAIGSFDLCNVLLMNDASFPWIVLVPKRNDLTELYHLTETDQNQLIKESIFVARTLAQLFAADKINVAALGNTVPQLHIHHIVRYKTDKAWPHPVWGRVARQTYRPDDLETLVSKFRSALEAMLID